MADWKQAFAVINNALSVISAAGSTPGVNLIPYVSTVAAGAAVLQAGLNAAVNVAPYIEAISETFSGGLPTEAQRVALDAKIAELEAKVDAPLPPKEDGEED
jgi:hypothetical protein